MRIYKLTPNSSPSLCSFAEFQVMTVREEDMGILKEILSQPVSAIESVGIAPTFEQVSYYLAELIDYIPLPLKVGNTYDSRVSSLLDYGYGLLLIAEFRNKWKT
uniref:Uncharacterized protein n=1 Tax=Parascaris equorum TaxID=6256 RepID=A0A914R6K4_PAREQ